MTSESALLIVDDNDVNRQILTFILQDHYSNLHTADNGVACLQQLHQRPFDLLLLDLNMPCKSGFDVLSELQQQPPANRPAIIVVSADNQPATISRALQLGAADYVTTPFNRDELLARVSTHLTLRLREQDLELRVQQRTAELEAANRRLLETQQQLMLTDKMASLGLLSAGIAHEINNPIGYMLSNMETLSEYCHQLFDLLALYEASETAIADDSIRQQLTEVRRHINLAFLREDIPPLIRDSVTGARRVKQIVGDLKVFSHPAQQGWETLDLTSCLSGVLNIINSEIKYKAEVHQQVADDLPAIECITPQIYQVFTNLLVNAAQAIEGFGRIDIRMRALAEAEAVEICIADNGQGMDDTTRGRIFDPFFTTKGVGVGTGLGLSVIYGIIQNHHGTIEVASTPGEGTRFTVTLPQHQPR
ncbi:response regulator [Pseudomaricurvus sp. HS19]|uniref:response regulator n=1 Tax=Pseudomaricurvus sp. HS19 TaxID=2692626 RepID=UPI00136BA97C|nr:response regulator [Pseudomaricurvus sp. HS19]MYM64546.1 response regulator [Pseudomaricurvus sp. HS19]